MSERALGLKRLRHVHPMVGDGLLAAFLLAVAIPQQFLGNPIYDTMGVRFRDGNWLGVLLLCCEVLPIVWRRLVPVPMLAAGTAASLALLLGGFEPTVADVALFVLLYSVAGRSSWRAAIWTGLAFAATLTAMAVIGEVKYPEQPTSPQNYVLLYASFAFAFLLGRLQHARRRHTERLEALNAQLALERESKARWAVAEERSRIARELHDVIAHAVSVMVVQAGAARRVVRSRPDQAQDAMTSIESSGRQALAEMRRLVGMLREVDEPTSLDPQPRLADVAGLVEQVREAGLPVELLVEGDPRPLPAGVDLSAYRIVQEALTNVRKHAGPASVRVRLRYGERALEVEVIDNGRGAGRVAAAGAAAVAPLAAPANGNGVGAPAAPGHGLIGMRERVALYGGHLDVGPRPGGGFRVAADLPLEATGR